MITPIRFLTEKEIKDLHKRIEKLGREGLIKDFLDKGWCLESAELLADSMLQSPSKKETPK